MSCRISTPRTRNSLVVGAALLVAAIRLSSQLFCPPIIGLASNADFEKVMAYVGLDYLTENYNERYWGWAVKDFAIVGKSPFRAYHLSSEIPLVGLAVAGTRLLSTRPILDIRAVGAIHAVLFLVALGLLCTACRELAVSTQCLVASVLVFFFTDVGYIAPFNSLYGQTASLLFLMLTLGVAALAVRDGALAGWRLPLYFLCAALFVSSKPQESLQAPILALLGLRLAGSTGSPRWRRAPVWLAFGLCVFSAWYYSKIPLLEIRQVGTYHTVFMDLLPNSPNPKRDLADLGLDPSYIRYSGRHAYLPGSPLGDPAFQAGFFQRFNHATLVRFYVTHPLRFLDRLRRAGRLAFDLRPENLGNFEQSSGVPPKAKTQRNATWSGWRRGLGSHGLIWITLLFAGNLVAVALAARGRPRRVTLFHEAVVALILMAVLEFLVCSLADDLGDLPRHLYEFHAMVDLLIVADVGWLAQSLISRQRAARLVRRSSLLFDPQQRGLE